MSGDVMWNGALILAAVICFAILIWLLVDFLRSF